MVSADKMDADFLETFLTPLRVCVNYRPAFGSASAAGLSLRDFQELYGADEFYSWIGLDSPLVYSAHKAAGGMTSIYRQIGVGAERLLREIMKTSLGLTDEQCKWQYDYTKSRGKKAVHFLDARISLSDLRADSRPLFKDWMEKALIRTGGRSSQSLTGAVFEIRQGYKSADSKRQNADLRFGARAYQNGLLPVVLVLSSQVSETVIQRYRDAGMLVLTGIRSSDSTISSFAFFKEIVGYDLEAFFKRVSPQIKDVVHEIIGKLLTP